MRGSGFRHLAAGLLILAGSHTMGLAQTTTAPATPTPPAQPSTAVPTPPPAQPSTAAPATPPAQPSTVAPTTPAPAPEATPAPAPATTPGANPPKSTDQIPQTDDSATPAPEAQPGTDATPAPDQGASEGEQPDAGAADGQDAPEELSLGEIPDIKIVDLTAQTAKAAIDTYALLKDKYKDAKLEDYETLQDFVDKDPQGKAFDADVKAAGFADVEVWNQTITTVSTTYTSMVNDQTAETQAQIAEVEKDTELAKDMKDKLLASLKALIPTENNRKVIQEIMNDPAYSEKLKQLESEEE